MGLWVQQGTRSGSNKQDWADWGNIPNTRLKNSITKRTGKSIYKNRQMDSRGVP